MHILFAPFRFCLLFTNCMNWLWSLNINSILDLCDHTVLCHPADLILQYPQQYYSHSWTAGPAAAAENLNRASEGNYTVFSLHLASHHLLFCQVLLFG